MRGNLQTKSFAELGLSPKVLAAVEAAGYTTPTPIQAEAIPVALTGRDVLGIAQTGTGKTASFVLPMITRLESGRARARMPRSLILAPTRELAAQVAQSFEKYGVNHKLNVALLIGGVSMDDQTRTLDRGADVLIATPGRLLDHFQRGRVMLMGVEILVIDEADRMLDMGFLPDIRRLLGFFAKDRPRQTLMFSATFPDAIERLAGRLMKDPVRVDVTTPVRTPENIVLGAYYVEKVRKPRLLRELLQEPGMASVMVFCGMKVEADFIYEVLKEDGRNVAVLHSDRDQKERTRALQAFREGKVAILVATDIAARGLDIKDVTHVINYDLPNNFEDFVHRVGRTARAEAHGEALSFVTPGDRLTFSQIERRLGRPIERRSFRDITLDGEWMDEKPVFEQTTPPAVSADAEPEAAVAPPPVRRRRR